MTTMGKGFVGLMAGIGTIATTAVIIVLAKRAIVKHEIRKAIEQQLEAKELLANGLSAEPDNRFEPKSSKSDNSKRYPNNPAPSSPRLSTSTGQKINPVPLLPRNDFSVFAKYIISSYNEKVAKLSGRFRVVISNSQKADAAREYLTVWTSILKDDLVQNYVKTLKLKADNGSDIKTQLMEWLQSLATPANKKKLRDLITDLSMELERIAPEIPESLKNGQREITDLEHFTEEELVLLYKAKPLIDKFINGIGSII